MSNETAAAANPAPIPPTPQPPPKPETPAPTPVAVPTLAPEVKIETETKVETPAAEIPATGFQLELPEGSLLDEAHVDKVVSFAKERGLSKEQAQAILNRDAAEKADFVKANRPGGETWQKQVGSYHQICLADKEIGGSEENLKKSAEYAHRVIEKHFSPNIKEFLDQTGLGSHPDFVRGFARLGRSMAEDQASHGSSIPAPKEKTLAERLFANHK